MPARHAFPILAVLLLAACGQPVGGAPDITLTDGWVRTTPDGADVTAAYFTLTNSGGADRLLSVSSDQVERVEMHRGHTDAAGVMRMEHAESIAIPASDATALAPGGDQLMLYGAADLALGHTVCMRLNFAKSPGRIACLPVMDEPPLFGRQAIRD